MNINDTPISPEVEAINQKLAQTANDPDMTMISSCPVYECFICQATYDDSKAGCTKTCKKPGIEKYRKP